MCSWEADPAQSRNPKFAGGANEVSLDQAQRNYIECGVCHPELRPRARAPFTTELPLEVPLAGNPKEKRMRLRFSAGRRILALVRGILSKELTVIQGAVAIAPLIRGLDDIDIEDRLCAFSAIASEVDGFPIGGVRDYWDPEALAEQDRMLADYEERLHDPVFGLCLELEPVLCDSLLDQLDHPGVQPLA